MICVLLFLWMACVHAQALQVPNDFRDFVQTIQIAQIGDEKADFVVNALDENTLHVKMSFELPNEIQQDDWQVNIIPAFRPSFHWAPQRVPPKQRLGHLLLGQLQP